MRSLIVALFLIMFSAIGLAADGGTGPAYQVFSSKGRGSGFAVQGGLIVTAAHVVDDDKMVRVTDENGRNTKAVVVAIDKDVDVAILRPVEALKGTELPLECKEIPKIGSEIHYVGWPGDYGPVYMKGIVAGPAKMSQPWPLVYVVQMPAIPGMSGGGVIDSRGYAVGILVGVPLFSVRGIDPGLVALGFVVPSTAACHLIDTLS